MKKEVFLVFTVMLFSISASAETLEDRQQAFTHKCSTERSSGFAGGVGSIEDPYRICNIEQLSKIREDSSAHYRLTRDLDLSPIRNWDPIGSLEDEFSGSFDGDGFTIYNLKIIRPTEPSVGLFSRATLESSLSNIHLKNVNIIGRNGTGGLVGVTSGSIENVVVEGRISGTSYVGGISSWLGERTENALFKGDVTGDVIVGGIGGANVFGEVINSQAVASVTGINIVGGLIGGNQGSIFHSNSAGFVKGNLSVGGLVGVSEFEHAEVHSSFSESNIVGVSRVGGLVGLSKETTIAESYTLGNIKGDDEVGGLVGHSDTSSLSNSYSASGVSGEELTGGLIGRVVEENIIVNSYWDVGASGQLQSAGGEGRTTTEMTSVPRPDNTYVNWNFASTWDQEDGEYPVLRPQN